MARTTLIRDGGQGPSRSFMVARAVLASVALITAACGQKAGIYGSAAPLATPAATESGSVFVVDPDTGEITSVDPSVLTDQGDLGSTTVGETVRSGGNDASTLNQASGFPDPAAASRPPNGGSTSGVTDTTIKLGIHFPLTGAAPIPATAIRSAKIYWEYLKDKGLQIAGRDVEIVWKDDRFDATHARAMCKEMVEQDDVFALVGFAGPFGIQACARYASSVGVPYFAPGSLEAPLTGLPTSFSLSMTYTRQYPLIADILVTDLDARTRKNALVRAASPPPPPGFMTPAQAMENRNAQFEVDHQVALQASYPEMRSVVNDLKQRGIDNVWLIGSPFHFIYFTREAKMQGYDPNLIGPGPTAGFEFSLDASCPQVGGGDGALMFHPTPAYGDQASFDPDFDEAGHTNEFDWLFWGLSKPIGELLKLPGTNLTRERLLWYTARARNIETGVYPPLSYSPEDHFGGDSMHLLRADCDAMAWKTEKAFFSLPD